MLQQQAPRLSACRRGVARAPRRRQRGHAERRDAALAGVRLRLARRGAGPAFSTRRRRGHQRQGQDGAGPACVGWAGSYRQVS